MLRKNKNLILRIFMTIGLILLYEIGSNLIIPGVDGNKSKDILKHSDALTTLSLMSGGGFKSLSLFSLGLAPFISSQMMVQLLQGDISPKLTRWSKEGDKGKAKIDKLTKLITLGLAIVQGLTLSYSVNSLSGGSILQNNSLWGHMMVTFYFTIGCFLVLLIAELITTKGVGNGTTMIILVGITTSIIPTIVGYKQHWYMFALFLLFLLVLGVVVYSSIRTFKLHYATKVEVSKEILSFTNLPFRVFITGVMPMIFASSLIGFVNLLASRFLTNPISREIWLWTNMKSFQSSILLGISLLFFSFVYTKINLRAKQRSDDLKKTKGYILNIRPGKDTEEFIDTIQSRLAIFSTLYLWLIISLPMLVSHLFNLPFEFKFSGTGVLILITTYIETSKKVKSKMKILDYKIFQNLGSKKRT